MKTLLIDFEKYHIETYPQIVHSTVHTNKEKVTTRNIQKEQKNKRNENEYQLKLRLEVNKTQKEIVVEIVKKLTEKVANFNQFTKEIKAIENLKIYTYRSKIKGVLYQNRKYRFSTLKISKDKIIQLEKIQDRLNQLSLIEETHKKQRNQKMEVER